MPEDTEFLVESLTEGYGSGIVLPRIKAVLSRAQEELNLVSSVANKCVSLVSGDSDMREYLGKLRTHLNGVHQDLQSLQSELQKLS